MNRNLTVVIGEGVEVVIELQLGNIAGAGADVDTRVRLARDEIAETVTDGATVGSEMTAEREIEIATIGVGDQAETEMIAAHAPAHALAIDAEVTDHVVVIDGTETETETKIGTVIEIEIGTATVSGIVSDGIWLHRKRKKLGSNNR